MRGVAMGMADIVPGVSGGTIALVLGIYERLIAAVRDGAAFLSHGVRLDLRGAWRRFLAIEWGLVLPVLLGIGVAIVTMATLIEGLLEERPILMSAIFGGLILGSIGVVERDVERWDLVRVGVALATATAAFALLGLRGPPATDPPLLAAFGAGLIGICGMILPGVSGAFILLILGMYEAALAAISARDVFFIGAFGIGAVIGLASFGTLLKWLLDRYHATVLAALIGLMAGSLRVLWPWPGEEFADPGFGSPVLRDVPMVLAAAAVAAGLVYVLGLLGRPDGALREGH
jgi:putative membrane protein